MDKETDHLFSWVGGTREAIIGPLHRRTRLVNYLVGWVEREKVRCTIIRRHT